jgi:hypothetical protein
VSGQSPPLPASLSSCFSHSASSWHKLPSSSLLPYQSSSVLEFASQPEICTSSHLFFRSAVISLTQKPSWSSSRTMRAMPMLFRLAKLKSLCRIRSPATKPRKVKLAKWGQSTSRSLVKQYSGKFILLGVDRFPTDCPHISIVYCTLGDSNITRGRQRAISSFSMSSTIGARELRDAECAPGNIGNIESWTSPRTASFWFHHEPNCFGPDPKPPVHDEIERLANSRC